ncbi:MAG: CRTAC1 family protein [Polyangiales bacterium]
MSRSSRETRSGEGWRRRRAARILAGALALGCTDASTPHRRDECPAPTRPAVDPGTIQGGFVDLSAPLTDAPPFALAPGDGRVQEPEATTGLFADLDGDRVDEVIVGPTAIGPEAPRGRRATVYRLDRATDRLVAVGPLAADALDAAPLALVDLDGDGARDVLYAGDLGRIAWGLADGGFSPPATVAPLDPNGVSVSLTHVDLDDLDRDGWLDVLVASRYCNDRSTSLMPLLRVAPRRFEAHPALFPEGAPRISTYSVQVAEFQPGVKLINVTGQGCAPHAWSFLQERGEGDDGRPRFVRVDPIPADAYFNGFSPSAQNVIADFAPMASAVGDLDGDGRLDLAMSLDPHHAFYRSRDAWPFADVTACVGFPEVRLPSGSRMIPWGVALLDLNRDGWLDVVTTHGNDNAAWFQPTAFLGPQSTTAHLQNGGRPFVDVSARLGLSRPGQWRALTVGDLDRDGDPDLVVGGQGEFPRVYRNAIQGPHAGLSLRLRGTSSNHLGVGARVTVTPRAGAPAQLHVASSVASPYAYSEPLVFAGLGGTAPAARVSIQWPSGVVQVLTNVAPGTLHEVVEPSLFTLDPPSRHAPADGATAVTLRITPRNEDGSLRTVGAVAVALRGPGTLAQPPRSTPAGWEARIVAPSSPGSTRIDLRIDGVAVGVHPRLWWD